MNLAKVPHDGFESGMSGSPRLAFYLRSSGNLHYFAAVQPYLDYFMKDDRYQVFLVVQDTTTQLHPEYAGYQHLLTNNCDLDTYDLVITPSFLRAEERSDRTQAVQIFHGMSDKPFTYERDFSGYVRCLCVGQRQVDRLLKTPCNQSMRWTLVGYPKFDYPPKSLPLFQNDKKTIIYCPTWRKEHISSIEIFLDHPAVMVELSLDYNLIVKPHPNIFNPDRQFYDQSIVDRLEQIQQVPDVKLIRSGNVMPWYAQADLLIGDISAAGYEWLYFNKPIVFLNPQPGKLEPSQDIEAMTYLWQCGPVCDDMQRLKALVDHSLAIDPNQTIRESLLHYSVFQPRDNGATLRGITEIEDILAQQK
ncbi:MAG: hypothetical protein HC771_22605 [Synechococcales cyanobacterium CRU_2_2]|nr:hypothetical protein [Synechococcales cyanobacterium CRU_2_2]